MVEPTKPAGNIQGISVRNDKAPPKGEARADQEKTEAAEPVQDRVFLSEEALSLAQAAQAASDIRIALEENPGTILGLAPDFEGQPSTL